MLANGAQQRILFLIVGQARVLRNASRTRLRVFVPVETVKEPGHTESQLLAFMDELQDL
jgi:hypothetical protein